MRATHVLRVSALCGFLLALVSAQGCGDDGGKTVAAKDSGPDDSGGGNDDFDAGDAPLPQKHDAGMVKPGTPDMGLEGRCAIDTNKIFTAVETDTLLYGTPLAVDPIDSQFAIPYVDTSSGCLDAVYLATLAGSNTAPPPTAAIAVDNCALVSAPATTFAGGRWLVAFVDNHSGTDSVWVQPFDVDSDKMGADQLLSETQAKSIALNTLRDGTVLVAWADEDIGGTGAVKVRPLDENGKPTGPERVIETWKASAGSDPVKNPKLKYRGLVITTVGAEGAGLAYWRYDETFARSELMFHVLDKTGKPTLPQLIVTRTAGTYASIDVDVNETGGGIVYTQVEGSTGRQLWFQEIDDTGALATLGSDRGVAPPVRIVNSPFLGIDVSIAKLRVSYAIAYRALPAVNMDKSQIRVMFLNRGGNKLGDSDVSFTSDTGGRTAIKTAYDGRIVLGWTELTDEGKSRIRVVRLPCAG